MQDKLYLVIRDSAAFKLKYLPDTPKEIKALYPELHNGKHILMGIVLAHLDYDHLLKCSEIGIASSTLVKPKALPAVEKTVKSTKTKSRKKRDKRQNARTSGKS